MKKLFALSACLALAACGPDPVRFIAPPPERTAQVAAASIPPATTPCPFDPAAMCNTDEELANTIAAYDAALAEANRKLGWLGNFFSAVPTKKP